MFCREVRELATKYTTVGENHCVWIGYTDRATQGTWRLLNGKSFDAHDRNQDAVAYWGVGEPSATYWGRVQDCANIWRIYGRLAVDDQECDWSHCYGICEIKTNKCSV